MRLPELETPSQGAQALVASKQGLNRPQIKENHGRRPGGTCLPSVRFLDQIFEQPSQPIKSQGLFYFQGQ